MKIIKQTANELRIQTRGVCDFWLHSCLLIVFGLKWVAFDGHLVTLNCHRIQATQGKCQLVRSSFLGSNIQEIELASLQGSKVVRCGYTSKLVLLTDAGDVPFARNYTYWGDKEAIAGKINSFVKNAEHRLLNFKQHDSLFEWIGGIFVTAGIGVIAFGKNEIYSFDKNLDTLTVKQQGLLGTQVIQHPLHEIYGVEVEKSKDRDNDIVYQLNLLSKKVSRISLASTMNQYKQQQIAKAINNYLNSL